VFWKSPNTQTTPEAQVNIHRLARTTPVSREIIAARCISGLSADVVGEQFGTSGRTSRKWTQRYKSEGAVGLQDRSSRPLVSPTALTPEWKAAIEALRRLRFTQAQIAAVLGLSKSRVQRSVAAMGLAKLSALEPPVPENRYERKNPGELIHVDTKKLGRFYMPGHRVTGNRAVGGIRGNNGWEFLHIAIDDRTRLAYAELLPDEKTQTCIGFIRRAAKFYRRHGITIERVMSDNGVGYKKQFTKALVELGAEHKRTRPYTPRTNGKAERFIQTMLRLWAYVRPYNSSDERAAVLAPWMLWYNRQRPHGSLNNMSPVETLKQLRRNNVLGDHS
jgi:transposase InsO family protein